MKSKNKFSVLCVSLMFLISGFSQNNALNFDGVDDYVNLNSIAPLIENATNFTIEFWMKADALEQSQERVVLFSVNRPAPTGDNEFLIIMGGTGTVQEGKLIIYDQNLMSGGGAQFEIVSSNVIGDNKCHHIAYTRNGNTGEAFIDGVSIGTHTIGYNFSSSHRFSLAQDWDAMLTSEFYNGNIDDFRIWNISRTEFDIQNNMNSELVGNEINLLVYYDFNQGIASGNNTNEIILNDGTTNSLNGNLLDFTLSGGTSNWVMVNCISSITVCDSTVYDTVIVYDTIRVTIYDTVTVFDTVVIYDTISIGGSGDPTNFEEVNNIENSVSIYPNPSNGGFNIKMQGDKQKFTLFEVYDTKGSLVLSKKIDNILTTIYYNEIGITGVYYVRFMTNDRKNQLVKKVIVD